MSINGQRFSARGYAAPKAIIRTLMAAEHDLSVPELARRTGFDKNTVRYSVEDLIDQGAVEKSREMCHTYTYSVTQPVIPARFPVVEQPDTSE